MKIRRRKLLIGMAAFAASGFTIAKNRKTITPRQTAGPFYPIEFPLDDDNDLTWVKDKPSRALGQISDLSGRIMDTSGNPINDTRIEIWQCDAYGRYRHPNDRGTPERDDNFQGHGKTVSDQDGGFRFRTIRPVPYPGRTPHIHVAVFPTGAQPFTTQLYVAGDSRNEQDFLYRRIPVTQRPLITSAFLKSSRSGVDFVATFDIVLGGNSDGTPTM